MHVITNQQYLSGNEYSLLKKVGVEQYSACWKSVLDLTDGDLQTVHDLIDLPDGHHRMDLLHHQYDGHLQTVHDLTDLTVGHLQTLHDLNDLPDSHHQMDLLHHQYERDIHLHQHEYQLPHRSELHYH